MSVESLDEMRALEAEVMGEVDGSGVEDAAPMGKSREFIGGEQCAALVGMLFDVVASRAGDKWQLKSEEKVALGEALDPVLAKYMPESGSNGAEIQLAVVALAVFLPRMGSEGDAKGAGNGKA